MILIRQRPVSIMVCSCVALHMWWAFLLMLDDSASMATGLAALQKIIPNNMYLSLALFTASCASLMGILIVRPWAIVLLLFQQVLLLFSAAGTVEAIWLSQFADGVIRSRTFIAADQGYAFIMAVCHSVALAMHVKLSRKWMT